MYDRSRSGNRFKYVRMADGRDVYINELPDGRDVVRLEFTCDADLIPLCEDLLSVRCRTRSLSPAHKLAILKI